MLTSKLAPVTLRFSGCTKSRGQSAARMNGATTTRRKPTTRDHGRKRVNYACYSNSAARYVPRLLVDGHGQNAAGGEDDGQDEVQAGAHPSRDAHVNVRWACCFGLGKQIWCAPSGRWPWTGCNRR